MPAQENSNDGKFYFITDGKLLVMKAFIKTYVGTPGVIISEFFNKVQLILDGNKRPERPNSDKQRITPK